MDATVTTFRAAEPTTSPVTGARGAAPTPPPEDFFVDDWLVQPTLGRVSRGDKTLRLRPQLMDVLVCLASGHGRTVGKQELLDRVWDSRFVASSAIARAVAELRQAFGDDARQPRIIQTIPKRGYRIIAPVARSAPMPTVDVAAPLDAPRLPGARTVAAFWPLVVLLLGVVAVALVLAGRLAA
jgi:DNA-binding winged helix-turn-helix (wHTH) protein